MIIEAGDELLVSLVFLGMLMIAAFLYGAVGHGGASGYLAIMALIGTEPALMKSSALMLNIVVSFIAFVQYYRRGYFDLKLFSLFALTSVPASYLGALFIPDPVIYKRVLAGCLVFAVLKLLGLGKPESDEIKPVPTYGALAIGALIGMLSGMIGIGGGILLSPIILFFHWAKMKQTAGISALFIFVNSIAGLMGLVTAGVNVHPQIYYMLVLVPIGGFVGSYWGSNLAGNKSLRGVLAVVLIIAIAKLVGM